MTNGGNDGAMVPHGHHRNANEAPFDRLYRSGLITAAKQQLAHEEHKRQALLREREETNAAQECTFHPRINLTSSSVASEWVSDPEEACIRLFHLGQQQLHKKQETLEAMERYVARTHRANSPRCTAEEQEDLFHRLAKPHRSTLRQQRHLATLRKEPSFKPVLACATQRLYEQSRRRREAEELQAKHFKDIHDAYNEQTKRARGVIKSRGGPTCVSGNPNCRCPEHHHHHQEGVHAGNNVTVESNNAEGDVDSSMRKPKSLHKVVSKHLLAIPVHRLQDRYADPNARPAAGSARSATPPAWPADSPFFAYLAPKVGPHHTSIAKEPPAGKLSLEDLQRHELLMRARGGSV